MLATIVELHTSLFNYPHRVGCVQEQASSDDEDSDDEANNTENLSPNKPSRQISPVVRTKKKRKLYKDEDDYVDSPEPTKKKRTSRAASPGTLALSRERCNEFKGVSFRQADTKFLAYFQRDKKMRGLGYYYVSLCTVSDPSRVTSYKL
jgi:hypothetical protein